MHKIKYFLMRLGIIKRKLIPGADPAINRSIWADALDSGDYEQGIGMLRSDDNKFCCLGVLCDLTGEGWGPVIGEAFELRNEWTGTCPPDIFEMVDMPVNQDHLMGMNDNAKKSFHEIAEFIRAAR